MYKRVSTEACGFGTIGLGQLLVRKPATGTGKFLGDMDVDYGCVLTHNATPPNAMLERIVEKKNLRKNFDVDLVRKV